jgi:spore maturation protein SpmA
MESLQELNPDKDRASDAQIMFMCLHVQVNVDCNLYYRVSAAGAANPADVMLPCIITRLLVLLPLFLTLESEKKLILRVL